MLFSGTKLVVADQTGLGQIKREVADLPGVLGIQSKSLGTVADPHVFVAYIRDHRGLADPKDFNAYWGLHNLLRQRIDTAPRTIKPILSTALNRLYSGEAPFEQFTNLADGRKWGKYYDAKADFLEVKPVPPSSSWWDSVKGAVKKIGSAIVWFGETVWQIVVALCERLKKETDSKTRREAAVAIISAAASPAVGASVAGALETARKICDGVAYVDAMGSGAPDAPAPSDANPNYWGRIAEVVAAARAPFTRVQSYPSGAFAVYDPETSKFRIVVPA